MDTRDVDDPRAGVDLVPVMRGSLADVKEMLQRCRDEDIPAMAGCPPGVGKG